MELNNLDLTTLWAMRQLLRATEKSSADDRHEIDIEIQKRMYAEEATKSALGSDMYLDMTDRTTWEYNTAGVKRLQEFLVPSLVSLEEWDRNVRWNPKVDGRAVRKWMQLGGAVEALVHAARTGTSGRTDLKGPEMSELQNKRPDVLAEAGGLLP